MVFPDAFAEASNRVGQVAEGLVAIDQALRRSEGTEARWDMADLLRIEGELVLLARGQSSVDSAQDHFWKASTGALPIPAFLGIACGDEALQALARPGSNKRRASFLRQFSTDSLRASIRLIC
jgi:hypothetical protein